MNNIEKAYKLCAEHIAGDSSYDAYEIVEEVTALLGEELDKPSNEKRYENWVIAFDQFIHELEEANEYEMRANELCETETEDAGEELRFAVDLGFTSFKDAVRWCETSRMIKEFEALRKIGKYMIANDISSDEFYLALGKWGQSWFGVTYKDAINCAILNKYQYVRQINSEK